MKCLKYLFLLVLFPVETQACGFEAKGLTQDNQAKVSQALSQITKEFDLDVKTGSIHFKTKEVVTLQQVQDALQKDGISDVSVHAAAH